MTHRSLSRVPLLRAPRASRARTAVAIGVAVAVVGAGTAAAQAGGWLSSAPSHDFRSVPDTFTGHGTVTGDVLRNDTGATVVVRHTAPADGKVTVAADGSFTYTPDAGFKGTDTFTYTASDAVQLFKDTQRNGTSLPALDKVAGPGGTTTTVSGEGYGSSLSPVPGRSGYFYGLTDRGPNADAPDGNKSEMETGFTPQIGEFKLVDGKAELVKKVTLKGPKKLGGVNYSGRPPHDTSEVIDDVDATNANGGTPVPVTKDAYGYDSEGLVALPDGTFWVSDEYGPYITHFDANGYELGRLTPYRDSADNASHNIVGFLPAELADRVKNKGMEGLTVTPDGSTLVGIMQSALQQPDLGSTKAAGVTATRIVTVDLRTYKTKQYLYLLDDPATTGDANSEITALSNTKFLIDERDGAFEPFAGKTLYEADINGATDVSGLTVGGKSPEAFVGTSRTNAALTALTGAGVNVAQKQTYVDLGSLVSQLDPSGAFFGHDKVEGVATADGGRTLYLSDDNDFGIDTIAVDPDGKWTVHQKTLPSTGQTDNGEILKVDTTKLPAVLKTVTVTVHVR
ncbi:esterase-like activity of phytase family protein [Streptomyces sp. NPDC008150]|uniref:esterase-like activity of phytase family protein n=1 Tax=Streptomyces sp. NPDC008150 TaxID=3364816 RepID=UPI0036E95388